MDKKSLRSHILQQMGVLIEFDIISSTSLEEFMETYREIADSSDDISDLKKVSSLLMKKDHSNIPGFMNPTPGPKATSDPSLDKLAVALIEFILKKTQEPEDWGYIINYMITKLGLEFDDDETEDDVN
tara:strand:- start:323 stop:706 length:384 start_codon:yes stop_codon:yes gene_type:complete